MVKPKPGEEQTTKVKQNLVQWKTEPGPRLFPDMSLKNVLSYWIRFSQLIDYQIIVINYISRNYFGTFFTWEVNITIVV